MELAQASAEFELPDEVKNKPRLKLGNEFWYQWFWDTHTCRSAGMSEGPIPYTAIVAWADENEVTGEQRAVGIALVRRMDNAYLKYRVDKAEKERKIRETQSGQQSQ